MQIYPAAAESHWIRKGLTETEKGKTTSSQLQYALTKQFQALILFLSYLFVEKLASAKEENLGMHQVLDQTLQELNSIWKIGGLVIFDKQLYSSWLSIQISQRINLICLFFSIRKYHSLSLMVLVKVKCTFVYIVFDKFVQTSENFLSVMCNLDGVTI